MSELLLMPSEIESLLSLEDSELLDLLMPLPEPRKSSVLRQMATYMTPTETAISTPAQFASRMSQGKWIMARHLMAIDRAVMDTVTGKTENILVIESAPRHGKSEFISKWLSSWYLCRYPDRFVVLASSGAELAEKWGRAARGLVNEHGGQFGVTVSDTRSAAAEFETMAGGGMKTAGVAGDIMGRGFHLGIVDDFFKNSEAAFSPTIRDKQWEWWESTFFTRMEPGGVAILMATRWHEDDLIGRLVKAAESGDGLPVRRITLPAIAGETDYLGREPGEALWPERWPLGDDTATTINAFGKRVIGLKRRQQMMDPYLWAALYQQNPGKHGHTEWPAEYFGDTIWADNWPGIFEVSAIAVDPSKGKSTTKGDYSAIVFAGLSGGTLYLDADIARRPAEQIVADGIDMALTYRPDAFGVEANAFQEMLAAEFDRQCQARRVPPLPLYLITNTVNKELRIGRLGPYLKNGKIKLKRTPGCKLLLSQLEAWPLGDHDDGPDGLEMAIRLIGDVLHQPQDDPDFVQEICRT